MAFQFESSNEFEEKGYKWVYGEEESCGCRHEDECDGIFDDDFEVFPKQNQPQTSNTITTVEEHSDALHALRYMEINKALENGNKERFMQLTSNGWEQHVNQIKISNDNS